MIKDIPVNQIKAFLDRQSPKEDFERLKRDIKQNGVQVPIQVTKIEKSSKRKKNQNYRYQLVWGHRRLRAVKELKQKMIPAEIVKIDNKERVKRFFIENESREQLSAYEIAQLMEKEYGDYTIIELADKYNMNPKTVRDTLRALENASPALRKHLKQGSLTLDDARSISQVVNPREQTLVLNRVLEKGLRGNKLKKEVRSIKQIDSISNRSVQAKQKALKAELKNMIEEREAITKQYMNSVVALQEALDSFEIRQMLAKAKIDYSAFWSE